jgi:GcrA cell cycle regulator
MDWSNDKVEELRRLWGQGQTASRIAELLGGVTRNAVIGKAHRLGLRGRPSPIRRDENAPFVRVSRPSQPAQPAEEAMAEPVPQPVAERPAPAPVQPAAQAKTPQAGGRSCSWPMGDPKQPGFHFCGQEALAGRPYCAAHCSMAYQRKSEAAA